MPLHSAELEDIQMCEIAISPGTGLRNCVMLLNFVRRWVFLLCLFACIPVLVQAQGANALSVCFNTVALLFLCEIDSVCYAGLPRLMRERVKEAGRVVLADEQLDIAMKVKWVHLSAIVVAVCLLVQHRQATIVGVMFAPSMPFIVGRIVEEFMSSSSKPLISIVALGLVKGGALGLTGAMLWLLAISSIGWE